MFKDPQSPLWVAGVHVGKTGWGAQRGDRELDSAAFFLELQRALAFLLRDGKAF